MIIINIESSGIVLEYSTAKLGGLRSFNASDKVNSRITIFTLNYNTLNDFCKIFFNFLYTDPLEKKTLVLDNI